jgi:glycosyltransferase involved in cell wall biosynthesis
MRILIVSAAYHPQVNGVVRTLDTTIKYLEAWGHEVLVIHPGLFKTFPLPGYSEICIPYNTRELFKKIKKFAPHVIHIATEGIIGFKVRNWCIKHSRSFSTAYHTKFPEYLYEQFGFPQSISYAYIKWFHSKSEKVMVNTLSLKTFLEEKGFTNIAMWSRGVDTTLFYPRPKIKNYEGPVWLNVGRVSKEKNLDAFLSLDLPGTKVIVGDGPYKKELEEKYPNTIFLGKLEGEDLAQAYNEADVFVFPSKTDTFGLVIIEALQSGKPVAGYPVTGPIDIITNGVNGFVSDNLKDACLDCLSLQQENIIQSAKQYTWKYCTKQFLDNLIPMNPDYSDIIE